MTVCRLKAAAPKRRRHIETHGAGVRRAIVHHVHTYHCDVRELGVLRAFQPGEAIGAAQGTRWRTSAAYRFLHSQSFVLRQWDPSSKLREIPQTTNEMPLKILKILDSPARLS